MSTKPDIKPLKRKAWKYTKKRLPALHDFTFSIQGCKQFFRAWCLTPLSYLNTLTSHYLLKLLPVDICSAVGGWLGRIVMKYKYPASVANMRQNLSVIHPDWGAEIIDAVVTKNCENIGRFMAEFSVIHRICASTNRVTTTNFDNLLQAVEQGPVILTPLHLGNWEVLSSMAQYDDRGFHTFFLPPDNPAEAWIAQRTRKKLGANLLPVGMDGVRPALKILKQGGIVALPCDEGFNGRIRGPFFGRAPHLSGNTALVTRLARLSGAKICIVYSERTHGAHFNCHFEPAITLPVQQAGDNTESGLINDAVLLNEAIEQIIIRHIDQWYFLPDKL
ncbi:KDO2-lipid IV(A) lauroyltransferase [Methylobacillus rhizosphaerae]|uniref:KDO2-lipid IV(A) lauroyltransferase n=1 Tax=Methylobacillus rhizosphaerae TaxID=551994 RepID=A0A238YWP4_9PROT|nr:hypothetical protein [Methylobacillus rhizosphaerae]SNR75141.1 KDO2-lipid IV(A) lauroyltransferase [Methylobacillus rhizosphaerae]